jgi:hypothetical protein
MKIDEDDNDDYINVLNNKDDDYEKYLKPEKKVKKERETRNKTFLSLKRKRQQKQRSDIQKALIEIMGKNLKSMDEIRGYLASKFLDFSDSTIRFMSDIAYTKVVNGKLVVSDSFANKNIVYRVCSDLVNISFITNDILWIAMNFRKKINTANYSALPLTNITIKKMHISGPPFLFNGDLNHGYIQDNSPDFFAFDIHKEVGNNKVNNYASIFDFKNPAVVTRFNYKGKKYSSAELEGGVLVCSDDLLENAKGIYDKQVIFNSENFRKFNYIKPRIIEIKNKPRFIDCTLKPEDFCPAYLLLPIRDMKLHAEFEISFDYNDLFNYGIEYEKANGKIDYPSDFIYWDNLDGVIDLFAAFALTGSTFGLSDPSRNIFLNICKFYEKYSVNLRIWSKVMLDIQKYVINFFNSFNSRINYDKMKDMRDGFFKLVDQYNRLTKDEDKERIIDFFSSNLKLGQWSKCIFNQMNETLVKNLLNSILNILTNIETGHTDGMEEDLGKVANVIYSVTYSSGISDKTLFPVILSPGAFMGSGKIVGKEARNKYYAEIIENYVAEKKAKDIKMEKNNKSFNDFLNNLNDLRKQVVSFNVDTYINNNIDGIKKMDINVQEFKRRLTNLANSSLLENKVLNDDINVKLFEYKDKPEKIKEIVFGNIMDTWAQQILNEKNKQNIINNINNSINNLNRQKQNIIDEEERPRPHINKKKALAAPKLKLSNITYLDMLAGNANENNIGKSINLNEKPVDGTLVSKYYTNLITGSGVYDDFVNSIDQANMMAKEDPVKLMMAFPISKPVTDKTLETLGMPTLDNFLMGKGTITGRERLPANLIEKNKIANAYILSQTNTGNFKRDIANEVNYDLDSLDTNDPDVQSVAQDFYANQYDIIKNLESYQKGFSDQLAHKGDNSFDHLMET